MRVGIVANRTRQNTKSLKQLMRFLTSLKIPLVAVLRDSQNFVGAAAEGIGICDLPLYKAKQDLVAMADVMRWLDGSATVSREAVPLPDEQPTSEKGRQSLH